MQKKYWFLKLSSNITLTPKHQVRMNDSMTRNSLTILGLENEKTKFEVKNIIYRSEKDGRLSIYLKGFVNSCVTEKDRPLGLFDEGPLLL